MLDKEEKPSKITEEKYYGHNKTTFYDHIQNG